MSYESLSKHACELEGIHIKCHKKVSQNTHVNYRRLSFKMLHERISKHACELEGFHFKYHTKVSQNTHVN